jgi:hypothetical protein
MLFVTPSLGTDVVIAGHKDVETRNGRSGVGLGEPSDAVSCLPGGVSGGGI